VETRLEAKSGVIVRLRLVGAHIGLSPYFWTRTWAWWTPNSCVIYHF